MRDTIAGLVKSFGLVIFVVATLPLYLFGVVCSRLYLSLVRIIWRIVHHVLGYTSADEEALKWDWLHINLDTDISLPSNFIWGVATCSYQVEGGEPICNWLEWEKGTFPDGKPHVRRGEKCGAATDHYNRVTEDIGLMKQLKANSYRFGLSWEKIEPRQGYFDETVIAHYRSEIDQLIAKGIEPMITLHHFTEPLWFTKLGHFEKEENIDLILPFVKVSSCSVIVSFTAALSFTHACIHIYTHAVCYSLESLHGVRFKGEFMVHNQ
jgi:hypothetical protein